MFLCDHSSVYTFVTTSTPFEPQNKYATEMKSKIANGHCGGGEFCPNVSIAPVAADPAEFEGGEVGE